MKKFLLIVLALIVFVGVGLFMRKHPSPLQNTLHPDWQTSVTSVFEFS